MTKLQFTTADGCMNLADAARTFADIVRSMGAEFQLFLAKYCEKQKHETCELETRFNNLDLDDNGRMQVARRLDHAQTNIVDLEDRNQTYGPHTREWLKDTSRVAGRIEANLRSLKNLYDRTSQTPLALAA